MLDRELRPQLRGAAFTGNGAAVVGLVRRWRLLDDDDALQLIGDGLLAALAAQVDGAGEPADACANRLRERGWRGDADLADQLQARLGTHATPMLRPLAVDLEELAGILEGDPLYGGGRIDLWTGEVWTQSAVEYGREIGEMTEEDDDPDRWLPVDCEGSRPGYRDMERFIETRTDAGLADRLEIAIQGRGAFRRFNDVLARAPDQLDEWHVFAEERRFGRARAWLADEGYCVAPRGPASE